MIDFEILDQLKRNNILLRQIYDLLIQLTNEQKPIQRKQRNKDL
jgi:hypothetical protein